MKRTEGVALVRGIVIKVAPGTGQAFINGFAPGARGIVPGHKPTVLAFDAEVLDDRHVRLDFDYSACIGYGSNTKRVDGHMKAWIKRMARRACATVGPRHTYEVEDWGRVNWRNQLSRP